MASTTNYSWSTPDDTALVKDGASAIRTLGSSVDTTTKALNPSTTLGDIEYRSSTANTNTRLGIGTTGQVLTVSGGVPSWATSSSGGMTLISTTSLSGSSSVALTSIPGTYTNLQLVIDRPVVTSGGNWRVQVVPNNTSSAIINEVWMIPNTVSQNAGKAYIGDGALFTEAATKTGITINIMQYANASAFKHYNTYGVRTTTASGSADDDNPFAFSSGGTMYSTDAITSLYIKQSNAVNFTGGTAYLYGVK